MKKLIFTTFLLFSIIGLLHIPAGFIFASEITGTLSTGMPTTDATGNTTYQPTFTVTQPQNFGLPFNVDMETMIKIAIVSVLVIEIAALLIINSIKKRRRRLTRQVIGQ